MTSQENREMAVKMLAKSIKKELKIIEAAAEYCDDNVIGQLQDVLADIKEISSEAVFKKYI